MNIGEPIDPRVPYLRYIDDLAPARAIRCAGPRLKALRRAGRILGDRLREENRVVAVRTLPRATLLYPTKYAFNRAVPLPVPYVVMTHRTLLVQVKADGKLRNILFNPTDHDAARETPFLRKMIDQLGERGANLLTTRYGLIEDQLAEVGVRPEDIDLLVFDHFHTQDLRPLLGTTLEDERPARFPNAVLLAPRCEWEDWDDLHPLQRVWFIAHGKRGVPMDRVILTEGDIKLGEGCMLLRTPGHTSGNQTLFVNADRGVFGCSENGTSADSWSPHDSKIPGLRGFARQHEVDVVLNSNTPEFGAEQYSSMMLELAIVDRVPEEPAFVQMFPSSEVTPSTLSPGIRPSMVFGERDSGMVVTARRESARPRRRTKSQGQVRNVK